MLSGLENKIIANSSPTHLLCQNHPGARMKKREYQISSLEGS